MTHTTLSDAGRRLWLDDLRPKPHDYDYHARTAGEAISILMSGSVTHVSFDHDLGSPTEDGYLVAAWIEKSAFYGLLPRLTWEIHSQNPVGAHNIIEAMKGAERFWSMKENADA